MNFVLHEKNKNIWTKIENKDKTLVFCPQPESGPGIVAGADPSLLPRGKIGEVVSEILDAEVNYESWTLMHRYDRCREILKSGRIDSLNRDHMAYIYIWLRYSFTRQLTWQKRYNTRPA